MYGNSWRQGVISEHLRGEPTFLVDGVLSVVDDYDEVEPVLCSELVWVDTEEGRIDGRCGDYVDVELGGFACTGHAEERLQWASQSEAEIMAWERALDPY